MHSPVWSNILVVLASVSIVKLSGAICLDSTCASTVEGDAVGKSSLLQQSTMRASPKRAAPERGATKRTATKKSKPRAALKQPEQPPEPLAPAVDNQEEVAQETDTKEDVVADLQSFIASEEGKDQDESNPHILSALVDRTHNLIMGWSARAACTATVSMFFANAGQYVPEEQQTFPWVHDYREAMGPEVQPTLSDMTNSQFFKFKIVRNPFARAVSNWVHQTGTNFSDKARIQEVAAANGVSRDVSFLDWLRFVKKVGFEALDAHSQPQFSQWEKDGGRYDMVLQLEQPDFDEKLQEINARQNCKLEFKTMHVTGGPALISRQPDAESLHRPSNAELFSDPEAVELVKEIYADDFREYGYSQDLPAW